MGSSGLTAPGDLLWRLQGVERGAKCNWRCVDGEMRMIDAAQLLCSWMYVNELDLRLGDFEDAVTLRRHLAEATANQQQKIGALNACKQFRTRADAKVAGITTVHRIKQMSAPEGRGHRQSEPLGEVHQRNRRTFVPSTATDQRDRALREP